MKRRSLLSSILAAPAVAAGLAGRRASAQEVEPSSHVHLPWTPSDLPTFPEPPTAYGWGSPDVYWGRGLVTEDEYASVRVDIDRHVIHVSKRIRAAALNNVENTIEDLNAWDEPHAIDWITPYSFELVNGWRIDRPDLVVGASFGRRRCFLILGSTESAIRCSVDDGQPFTLPYRGAAEQLFTMEVADGAEVKFWTDTPCPGHFKVTAAPGQVPVALSWHRCLDDKYFPIFLEAGIEGDLGFRKFLGPRLAGELRRWHTPYLKRMGDD